MKANILFCAASVVFAAGLVLGGRAEAAEAKLNCSLSVSALKGESKLEKSGGNNGRGGTTTSAISRNLKWKARVSFSGATPEKPTLKVWYVGYSGDGGQMVSVGSAAHPLELNEKGVAVLELTSPTTTLTKKKTIRNGRNNRNGGNSVKKTVTGERVTGCVIQVFAGDELMKSWVSDSRWAKAAKEQSFSLDLIDPKGANKKK